MANWVSLENVRKSLIRQEDTIIFSLIERSKYPIPPSLYNDKCSLIPALSGSLLESIVKETEATQAKVKVFPLLFSFLVSVFFSKVRFLILYSAYPILRSVVSFLARICIWFVASVLG